MPDKISELYQVIPQGTFKDENEFRSYVTDEIKLKEFYSLLPQGSFKDENEFVGYFGESLKKKDLPLDPMLSTSKGETILQDFGQPSKEPTTLKLPYQSPKVDYEETLPESITPTSVMKSNVSKGKYLEQKQTELSYKITTDFEKESAKLKSDYEKKLSQEGANKKQLKEEYEVRVDDLKFRKEKEASNEWDKLLDSDNYEYLAPEDVKGLGKEIDNILSQQMPFDKRETSLNAIRDSFLSKVSILPADIQNTIKREINEVFAKKTLFDEKGDITPYGWKKEASQKLNEVQGAKNRIQSEFLNKYPDFYETMTPTPSGAIKQGFSPTIDKDPTKRQQFYADYIQYKKDLSLLGVAEEKLGNIMQTSEGKGTFADAFRMGGRDLLTAVSSVGWSDVAKAIENNTISTKVQKGEQLSEGEQAVFDAYGIFDAVKQGMTGGGFKLGNVFAQSLPMMESIASLNIMGVLGGAGTATLKQIAKKEGIKKLLTKEGVKLVGKEAAKLGGAMAKGAPLTPQSWIRQQTGEAGQKVLNEKGEWAIDKATVEGKVKATLKGLATGGTELGSEILGGYMGEFGQVLRKIPGIKNIRLPKVVGQMAKTAGMQGAPIEIAEEFINMLWQAPIGDQPLSEITLQDIWDTIWTTAGLTTILGSAALPSGIMNTVQRNRNYNIIRIAGRERVAAVRDAIINKDQGALNDAITQLRKGDLTEDQIKDVFSYAKSIATEVVAKDNAPESKPQETGETFTVPQVGTEPLVFKTKQEFFDWLDQNGEEKLPSPNEVGYLDNNVYRAMDEWKIDNAERLSREAWDREEKRAKELETKKLEEETKDAERSRIEDQKVAEQGAPELVGQEGDTGGVRYNEQVKVAEEEIAPQKPVVTDKKAEKVPQETKSILDQDKDLLGKEKEEAMVQVVYPENPEYFVNDDVYLNTDYGQTRGSRNVYSVRGRNEKGDYILWGKSNGANLVVKPEDIEKGVKQKRTSISGNIDAIDYAQGEGLYQQWIKEGRMTAADAIKIMESANIFVPQEVRDLASQESVQKPAEVTEVEQAPKEAITAPIEEKQGEVPPTVQEPPKVAESAPEGKKRTREIGAKVIESANVKQEVKDALLENGIEYVPRGQKYTLSELQEIVDLFATNEDGLDKLAQTVYDLKNDIKGDTRITLNVYIADKYSKLLDESTDPKTREKYRNKLADAYIFGQEFATEAGQTVEALKRWRELLSRDPESIIAIRKRQQSKNNAFALEGVEKDIKSAKEILDSIVNTEEFKQTIESEVNKEIDKIANKRYGEADKKKINDFFDGLLIKNDKAFDATIGIPIAVYNGAILVIKKAVLAGVDITNAIKQAVDYIDEWYKKNYAEGKIMSPGWNKDDYTAQMNSQLKPLSKKVKKVKYKVSKAVEDSLVDKIYAKMSSANKPQLRRLVREYITTLDTEGAISEQRFKDLFAQAIGLDVLTPEDEQKIRETAQSLKNATKTAEKLVAKFKELVNETDNAKIKQLEDDIKVLKKDAHKAKFEAQKAARKLAGLMTDKATLGSILHTLIQGNLLTLISLVSNVVGNTVFLPVRNASYMVASALDFMVSKLAETYTPLLNDPWVKANPRMRRLIESLPTPSREYDYFASVRGYWYGMPQGLEEGLRQVWTGTLPESEYRQYISQGLNPWKAALRLRDQLTGKEQIAFDTAMANFLEAFPSTYMAEGFFRLLNLGDKPYRRAAERSRLEEIASLKGLKGKQRDAFLNNPNPDSVEEARKEGDVAVYQQDTVVSEMFSWLNKRINRVAAEKATKRTSVIISTVGALLKATQAPYVKTPVNLIGEAIDYSIPSLSLFRALYYAKKGDKRKSYEYFGKAAVGYMLMNITFFLIKEGLLSPPTDDDDKIRQAQYDAKPGYSLNIDALWRRVDPFDNAKGSSEWKYKDKIVNIQRLGVFSMILMGQSKAYSEFPPDEMQKDMNFMDKSGYGLRMVPSVMGASLDQSFLSGTASGIKAFTEGGPSFDRWVISTSKALSAVVYPNTLAQISQVFFDDNYIREVRDMYSRDEKFKKQIINTFKDRAFMGKDLPAKVTLWGEKVNRVPEGESWAHIMFDVTRSIEYQKSSFGVRMFEWWERYRFIDETEARKILPSIPSGTNTVGWDDRNMTAKEVEEFQMAVGQRRKSYVENTMNSVEWEEMSEEERIVELEKIYRTQASKVKAGIFMLDVIKADPKVFSFLDDNDLIPVPAKTIAIEDRRLPLTKKHQIQKIKLNPEQTAEYYSNVQRHFVERLNNSGLTDREVELDERGRERLIKQVNGHWDKAKEIASRNWITSQNR